MSVAVQGRPSARHSQVLTSRVIPVAQGVSGQAGGLWLGHLQLPPYSGTEPSQQTKVVQSGVRVTGHLVMSPCLVMSN